MNTDKEFFGIVEGTLYWAFLRSHHPMSKKYQLKLGQLSRETAEVLKNAGAKINKDDEFGLNCTFRTEYMPDVVDANVQPMNDDDIKAVGNGTTAKVKVSIKPTNFSNASQGLKSVQIINFVRYQAPVKETDFLPVEQKTSAAKEQFEEFDA